MGLGGVFLTYQVVMFLWYAWSLRHVPGPLALPVVGHLHMPEFLSPMKFLASSRKKYGRFFQFWPGNTPLLVVAEPNAVRQVLTDTKHFVKGPDYTHKFAMVFGAGLVTSTGDKHKKDRSCLAKYFSRSSVEAHQERICAQTSALMEELLEEPAGRGEVVDMQDFFHLLSLYIFGQVAFSYDYSKDPLGKKIAHWVSAGSNVIGEHIVLGLPVWKCIPRIRTMLGHLNILHRHLDERFDERIAARAANATAEGGYTATDDPLDAMLAAGLPREEMYAHFTTLLAAGHDTTAFFMCYACYLLAGHPEAQQKLKREIKAVLRAEGRAGGRGAPITPAELGEMRYTRMVLQEVLRMYTVIPMVTRMATQDIELAAGGADAAAASSPRKPGEGGSDASSKLPPPTKEGTVRVPKGQQVLVPLTLLNRDPAVWDEPNEFKPERFEELCNSTSGYNSARHGYLPFGYGTRTCIGNTLAMVEGSCMLALMMDRYTFTPAPGYKPKLVCGISLVSSSGIKVTCSLDDQ